ncbi:MAG: glycosyltransferase [Williamsia sp.]|nr:glycosyltransferase [Williamsia sp.]
MIITFIHSQKAFLPEVGAYIKLFESIGIKCKTAAPHEVIRADTDVEWHFMGTDIRKAKEGRIKIHEYASGSIGRLGNFKDFSKKILNVKPDFRLFLNPYVNNRFKFKDNIPFGYRDMGVNADWLTQANHSKTNCKFDFVYIGDLSPARQPENLLNVFTKSPMKEKTLLIISSNYAHFQTAYFQFKNIVFKGPYNHSDIPSILSEACYGINYIIDEEPFNQQTSTKFLEYAACGLPIVSTKYKWIDEFRSKYGGNYYYLKPDLSNFAWDPIVNFTFSKPDLTNWMWEKQIKSSGIIQFLDSKMRITKNS